MNFLRGNDIAFHINPRFNEGGKQVVVRNHKVGERWGTEERDLKGPFPFALGSPFEVSLIMLRYNCCCSSGSTVSIRLTLAKVSCGFINRSASQA